MTLPAFDPNDSSTYTVTTADLQSIADGLNAHGGSGNTPSSLSNALLINTSVNNDRKLKEIAYAIWVLMQQP